MKILITGGAGYIGTELTYLLASHPEVEEVIIYDNLSRLNYNLFIGHQKFSQQKVRLVVGEMLDSRKLRKVLEGVDVVYHLAARVTTPFADQNPHLFEQVNNWGTAELAYAAEASGISGLIYLSSVSVYGAGNEEVDVNTPVNPRTFYGISKMRGEEHVSRLGDKLPVWILRCGNVYGYSKSMRFDAVINKFMFDANFTGRITINGSGEQHRSFISISKAVSALTAIWHKKPEPAIYNLVDKTLSIREISEVMQEIYPGLEFLFTNQHLKLRELRVKQDLRIAALNKDKNHSLKEELSEFKEQFTF